MTAAIMQCDQARPGPPSLGSPGIARNDLWQTRTCTFTSINAAGAYQWSVLDKPPGSLASFDTPTAQSANITFDKAGIDGTYRIMLSLDGGGPNSGTGTYQILVFRVRSDVNGVQVDRGWAMPAVGEQLLEGNYGGNTRGYDEPFRFMMKDILSFMVSGGSATAGGDLSGVVANATVQKIQNHAVSASPPSDEDVMTWVAANTRWEPKAITLPNLGGDTTGPPGANTTMKIRGAAVASAAGALVLGSVLRVVGGSALDYGPVDLSNASAVANQLAGSYVVPTFGAQAISGASLNTTGDVTVGGNLIVNGTTVTVNSTTLDVDARIVHANSHAIATVPVPTLIAGLEVERGDNGATKRDAAGVLWNESSSEWTFAYQTAANDTALGTFLQIKALGGTFTSLGSGGSGYASVNNNGTLGFTPTIGMGAVAGGTAGQVFITNGTPASAWTSLINVELTHGRFSAGGAGAEFKGMLGPLTANEGSYGGMWFLPSATSPTAVNVSVYGDASGVYLNTPASGGVIGFVSAGSTILAEFNWTQNRFYVGGSSAAAPMVIDWATPNETQLFAGSAQTLLTIGTVAAANIRFTGAGVTVAGIETTHGLAKFGGGGSDQAASIGPDLSTPTTRSGVFFNATGATAPTSVYSDQSSVVIQALGGWLLQWGPGGLLQSTAGSLVIGTNVATRTVTIQAGASVPVITASTASIAFGTVSSIELVHGFATFGGAGSDYKVAFGPDPGAPTAAATLHMLAPATTPSGSNYVLLSDGNITALNAVGSTLEFQLGTGSVWWLQGSTLINWMTSNFEWTESLTPLLYSDVATSDHPTHDFTIRAQYPYSLATLANRKPANIVLDIGVPTSGGTTEGYFSFTRNTSEIARVAAHPTTNSQIGLWLGSASFLAGQSNAVLLSDGSSYTYLNTKALGAIGLVIDDASFLMYMPGQANIAFWFSSTVGSAPFYFDVGGVNGSVTTPFISSGNAVTAFTLGTTKVGASFVIQSDAALKNISFDHPSTNVMQQSFYDHTGTPQMTLTVNDSTDFVTWALANSAYEFSWTVGSGVMDLATNFFAVGGGSAWWISASTTTVYFGGAVTATAPVIIDFTPSTTPTILSGSAATSLTAGTNMIGAAFTLSADANVKGLALSKPSSTVNQIDIYSPDGTSWAQVQTHNSTGQVSLTSPSGWWDIVSNSALAELQLNSTTQLFCNAANFLNWAGTHKFLRWSDSALTVTLGDTTLTNIIVGAVRGTHRDSAANFTIDTTTTDWQVRLTATQTVSLPTQTTGRWLPLILDATGVAVGTNMVITIHPPNTVRINNSTNDLVINVPGGEVQGWTVRGDSSGNWWIYPGG